MDLKYHIFFTVMKVQKYLECTLDHSIQATYICGPRAIERNHVQNELMEHHRLINIMENLKETHRSVWQNVCKRKYWLFKLMRATQFKIISVHPVTFELGLRVGL